MKHSLVAIVVATVATQATAFESSDCLILPGREVAIGATIPGLLAEVFVDRGDEVRAGQIVAKLRTEVQEAILAISKARASNMAPLETARARLRFAEEEFKRAETLTKRRVISQQVMDERLTAYQIRLREVEEAEAEAAMAALEVVRAEVELLVRHIQSPIDGVVTDRALDPGEYLRDDGNVITVSQLDPLRVEVFLPQAAYPKLSVGDPVQITSVDFGGSKMTATISVIDPVIDAASATIGVRLELSNPDYEIIAGTRCIADFQMAAE